MTDQTVSARERIADEVLRAENTLSQYSDYDIGSPQFNEQVWIATDRIIAIVREALLSEDDMSYVFEHGTVDVPSYAVQAIIGLRFHAAFGEQIRDE